MRVIWVKLHRGGIATSPTPLPQAELPVEGKTTDNKKEKKNNKVEEITSIFNNVIKEKQEKEKLEKLRTEKAKNKKPKIKIEIKPKVDNKTQRITSFFK